MILIDFKMPALRPFGLLLLFNLYPKHLIHGNIRSLSLLMEGIRECVGVELLGFLLNCWIIGQLLSMFGQYLKFISSIS